MYIQIQGYTYRCKVTHTDTIRLHVQLYVLTVYVQKNRIRVLLFLVKKKVHPSFILNSFNILLCNCLYIKYIERVCKAANMSIYIFEFSIRVFVIFFRSLYTNACMVLILYFVNFDINDTCKLHI